MWRTWTVDHDRLVARWVSVSPTNHKSVDSTVSHGPFKMGSLPGRVRDQVLNVRYLLTPPLSVLYNTEPASSAITSPLSPSISIRGPAESVAGSLASKKPPMDSSETPSVSWGAVDVNELVIWFTD